MSVWLEHALLLTLALFGAIGLVLSVRAFGAVMRLLPMSRTAQQKVHAWLPVVGVTVIVLYVGVVLDWLLGGSMRWLVPMLIVLVPVAASWGVIKNVVDGLFVRSSDTYRIGDYLALDDLEGRVSELGWRYLVLETRDSTVATVPYSRLAEAIVQRAPRAEHAHFHTFRVECPDVLPIPEVKRAIHRALLLSPWCLYKRAPEVRAVGGEIEVVVGLVDADHEVEAEAVTRNAIAAMTRRMSVAPGASLAPKKPR